MVSFVLPWVNVLGNRLAGYQIYQVWDNGPYLFLIPALALGTIVLGIAGQKNVAIGQVAGGLPLVLLAVAIYKLRGDLFEMLSIGGYLTIAAGFFLLCVAPRIAGRRFSIESAGRGLLRNMRGESTAGKVIEHWYTLIARHQFSSKEFYEHIKAEINAQQVPSLEIEHLDLSEGGVLSDKREYLRMQRERLRFDVCAAPVGVNYFFSYRFYELPAVVEPWEMCTFFVLLGAIVNLSVQNFGVFLGPALIIVALGFLVWLMRNAVGMGLRDVDATLLKIPILGSMYERYLRRDTYYRQDMRIAYCSIVSSIVKREVETLTATQGVQLLREFTYSPVFDGLYKAKEVKPDETKEAA